MAKKIKGFNAKEQAVFSLLAKGKALNIREMKGAFLKGDFLKECRKRAKAIWDEPGEREVDSIAQSFVRNGIRRLIRDGWAEGPGQNENMPRGTYQLTAQGKRRVKQGVVKTVSADTPRGRPKGTTVKKAKKPAVKAKAKPKTKATPKKAAAKKPAKKKAEVKAKAKKTPAKKPSKTPVKKAAKTPMKASGKNGKPARKPIKVVSKAKADGKADAKKKAAQAAARAAASAAAS